MTSEEQKWKASAFNPQKATKRLKYQYIMLGIWITLTLVWIAAILIERESEHNYWATSVILGAGYLNVIIGIISNKKVLKRAKSE